MGDEPRIPCRPNGIAPLKGIEERIEDVLIDAVSPQLRQLRIREVPVKNDPSKMTYLVWHAASIHAPHMITAYGDTSYYRRGKLPSCCHA